MSDPRAVCAASIARKRGRTRGRVNAKGKKRKGGGNERIKEMTTVARDLVAAKMAPWVLFNKGKKNPAAEDAYREFHGHDPEGTIEFYSRHHYPGKTAAIGELVSLSIRVPKERAGGTAAERTVDLSDFGEAWLTRHPNLKQLYVEGGDQAVDLGVFGLDDSDPHEVEYLGELVRCVYHTDKSHLGREGGDADYHHKFGTKESGLILDKTELIKVGYHVPDAQLIFVGGGYEIPPEGIDG